MWDCFDQFPKIVEKNKGQLGDLISVFTTYMKHGKQEFAIRESSITCYLQIVEKAMFTHKVISDVEGAVACQLLF